MEDSVSWLDYTGQSAEECRDMGWLNALHPDDREATAALWRDCMARRVPYAIEHRLRDRTGAYRWPLARAKPLLDPDGALKGWVGMTTDISAQKAAADARAAMNAELERQVEERTAQLLQAQRMEAVGRLTGGVAHDFNNLLQGVSGCLEVLAPRLSDPKGQAILDAARQAIERGGRLTQHLLAFARRQRLSPQPTDIPALLETMRPLLERTLGGVVRVRIDAPTESWPALIDPSQLELAVINLAINARDALPEGGELLIRTANVAVARSGEPGRPEELPPGRYVTVSVADSGTGMDPATLARAFEPFFTTKEVGKGSGLGLSMVHGMAAQSGGGVSIASAPGRGTTVTIYLPRATGAASVERAAATAVEHRNQGIVLLADDDVLVRTGTRSMLEAFGYHVVEAANGEEALRTLADHSAVIALVTDYAMPGMTGAGLVTAARRMAPTLPVLVMTGYVERPEGLGDTVVLTKPFTPAQLGRALGDLLPETRASNVVPLEFGRKTSPAGAPET